MALKTEPDDWYDEIKAAEALRDKHLKQLDNLVKCYTGRYYRSDRQSDIAVPENYGYKYLSVMQAAVAFDDPRVWLSTESPTVTSDLESGETFGDYIKTMQAMLNRWAINDDVADTLHELSVDFFFAYPIALVTLENQPGYGAADIVPQRPIVARISPKHFILDPAAKTWHVGLTGGPRYSGHMWKADAEDLIDSPEYDSEQVKLLMADQDLEKYDQERKDGNQSNIPARDEVLVWDIWVPEIKTSNEEAFNGTIFTVAVGQKREGQTKGARQIRAPRPAYCPPWGPYTVIGSKKVPDSPYPLSDLVATAEQAEEVNAHVVQAANDAKSYKRFSYNSTNQSGDAERIQNVRNGEHVQFDSTDDMGEMEVGGVSEAQYRYIAESRANLEEVGGLQSAKTGQPQKGITATAEAIAESGSNIRRDTISAQFRKGVRRIFKSVAWAAFYGEDVMMNIGGREAEQLGVTQFFGGTLKRPRYRFFDISFTIDPLSMGHTDQNVLQRQILTASDWLMRSAPIMVQTPWIDWSKTMRTVFEAFNINDADRWLDIDVLKQLQQLQMQASYGPTMTDVESVPAAGDKRTSAASNKLPGESPVARFPNVQVAKEQGAVAGNAAAF